VFTAADNFYPSEREKYTSLQHISYCYYYSHLYLLLPSSLLSYRFSSPKSIWNFLPPPPTCHMLWNWVLITLITELSVLVAGSCGVQILLCLK
jgi:hypothetical protein